MPENSRDCLVDTAWLAAHLSAPDVRVVDASYYLPNEGLEPRVEYEAHHIPGAVFFDIDAISDETSSLPHMLPSPEKFSSCVQKLGLGDGIRIVVYDQRGIWSAPRVWWTFRAFGHDDIVVLNGGLPKWMAEGRPVDEGPAPKVAERAFTARMNHVMVRDKHQIMVNLISQREQVLDTRARGRFEGTAPEPRQGMRSGHIPGSKNLPFTELIDPATQTMLPKEQLIAQFAAAGIDMHQPVITSCGSGITAAVLALGLQLAGHYDVALYDGSWTEWGQLGETPIDTGPVDTGPVNMGQVD